MIPFLDISHHQGPPDFDALVAAAPQIPGVIIRAGNGLSKDRQVDRNMAEAKRVGLARSAYWFANPKAALGGRGQGALLAAAHHLYGCELPPMWDAENYSSEAGPNRVLAGAPAARWLAEMVHTVDDDSGRFSLGYTGASYWNPAMTPGSFDRAMGRFTDEWRADLEFLHSHDFILSRYPGQHRVPPLVGKVVDNLPRGVKPAGWEFVALGTGKEPPPLAGRPRDWDAWQWSAGGNEQGVVYGCQSTDLDLNIARVEAWARWTVFIHPDPAPQPEPEPTPEPVPPISGDDMTVLDTPVRAWDSRPGSPQGGNGKHDTNETFLVDLTGKVAAPANARGVIVSLTVVDAEATGYLTVWGAGGRPSTSNVNFAPGEQKNTLAVVPLSGGGINTYTSARCNVIVDVQGWSL